MFKSKYRRKYQELCNQINILYEMLESDSVELGKLSKQYDNTLGYGEYMYCCGGKMILKILKEQF